MRSNEQYPTPSNDQAGTYEPCQPWCLYRPTGHDGGDDDYCQLALGREATGLTIDGHKYGIVAALVYGRVPVDAPVQRVAIANRAHRDVVQITAYPYPQKQGEELPEVTVDISPGDARSFAAALVHGADLAEGIIR